MSVMADSPVGIKATIKAAVPEGLLAPLGRMMGVDKRGYERISALGADSDNPWVRKSSQIGGWLFEGEHELLWELATADTRGDLLEIGTWMGKSACLFAGACIDHAPDTRLFAVDPFLMLGSDEQEKYHQRIVGRIEGTFYEFARHARELGFASHVIPLATVSEVALPALPDAAFRLAFIDGRHDYEGVSADTELAIPKLKPGGRLALHDATVYEGVQRHIDRDLRNDDRLAFERQVHSIAVFARR